MITYGPVLPIKALLPARAWIADCEWADLEPDQVDGLTLDQIDRAIAKHYEGGIAQFLIDQGCA